MEVVIVVVAAAPPLSVTPSSGSTTPFASVGGVGFGDEDDGTDADDIASFC
jgi:hypothetical protein